MNKERLALFSITCKHPVDMAFRASQSKSCSILVTVGMIRQSLDYFIFFLFVHREIHLSDNVFLLFVSLIGG